VAKLCAMLVCVLLHATTKTAQSHQQTHKPWVITNTWPLMAHTTNLKSSSACYSHWTDQNQSVTSTRPTTMHLSMHRVKLCLDCFYITAKFLYFLTVNTSPLLCVWKVCVPHTSEDFSSCGPIHSWQLLDMSYVSMWHAHAHAHTHTHTIANL
jgi:hypothetical protein